jgi:hypothetical protein
MQHWGKVENPVHLDIELSFSVCSRSCNEGSKLHNNIIRHATTNRKITIEYSNQIYLIGKCNSNNNNDANLNGYDVIYFFGNTSLANSTSQMIANCRFSYSMPEIPHLNGTNTVATTKQSKRVSKETMENICNVEY